MSYFVDCIYTRRSVSAAMWRRVFW